MASIVGGAAKPSRGMIRDALKGARFEWVLRPKCRAQLFEVNAAVIDEFHDERAKHECGYEGPIRWVNSRRPSRQDIPALAIQM